MRITAELIELSSSFINPLGHLQLDLRGNRIAEVENLFITRDSYEVFDLSDNEIEILDNLPLLTHLNELYLCNNSITQIPPSICNLSNLTVLNLQGNKIMDFPQISYLSGIKTLKCLIMIDNPICRTEGYRDRVAAIIPQLVFLDYQKIYSPKESSLLQRKIRVDNSHQNEEFVEELIKKAERAKDISDVKQIEKLLSSGLIK